MAHRPGEGGHHGILGRRRRGGWRRISPRPDTPPLFIAVGATHFNVTNGCLALFAAWKAGGRPAEIHVYDQVSAGFGMTRRGLPVDGWTDRLHEWLLARKIAQVR